MQIRQNVALRPILYVEDEENDVILIELSLKRAGIQQPLLTVRDGHEAIEYLAGNGRYSDRTEYPIPCLVLLDLNLPRLTGLEVLRWVSHEFLPGKPPVVVLTSSSLEEDLAHAHQLGASEYVVKTGDLALLASIATNWKHRWLDER